MIADHRGSLASVKTRFALAPMSASMWAMTIVCWAIPIAMWTGTRYAPPPVRDLMGWVVGLVVVLYVFVALWMRPTAFYTDPDGLELVWPMRQRRIERSAIIRARVLDMAQLKSELGYMMRVGAGGLWGGFGYAKTAIGMLELWVSRTDRIVYIECDQRKSLLITPEDPDRFVRELPTKQ